jgi:hypothetical protein
MSIRKAPAWVAIVLLSTATCLPAELASEWSIRCELLVARVPLKAGIVMRSRLKDEATIASAVNDLMAMIDKGEANLVGSAISWSRSEERAVSEAVEEVRYATEMDPPHSFPGNFGLVQPMYPEHEFDFYHLPPSLNVPTSFETRHAGLRFEFSVRPSEGGRYIDLDLVAQNVSYLGLQLIPSVESKDWRYKQPRFRFHAVTTSLYVSSGAWKLTAVDLIAEQRPAIEFTLVRVAAVPAGK